MQSYLGIEMMDINAGKTNKIGFCRQSDFHGWKRKEKNRINCLTAAGNGRIIHGVGSLAQLVEQLALNQEVAGSNPARPTNISYCFIPRYFICHL